MNKIIQILKFLLFTIVFILELKFLDKYHFFDYKFSDEFGFVFKLSLLLLLIIFVLNVIGIIIKDFVTKQKAYSFLTIIDLTSFLFLLLLCNYEKSILTNVFSKTNYYKLDFGIRYMKFFSYFIFILFILNLIYILINLISTKKKS